MPPGTLCDGCFPISLIVFSPRIKSIPIFIGRIATWEQLFLTCFGGAMNSFHYKLVYLRYHVVVALLLSMTLGFGIAKNAPAAAPTPSDGLVLLKKITIPPWTATGAATQTSTDVWAFDPSTNTIYFADRVTRASPQSIPPRTPSWARLRFPLATMRRLDRVLVRAAWWSRPTYTSWSSRIGTRL